jgi:heptosyltransferase-2
MKNNSNILIIKPGAIGDLLQLTPVFRALKGKYPDARISLVVSSRATASLFSHNPLIHEIIVFDSKGDHRSLGSLLGLWRRLRRARYDMVLNFQRSNLKAWFLASAAFPCRLLVYHKAKDRVVHAVVNHLETVFPLGIEASDFDLELYTGTDDETYAEKIFADSDLTGKRVIALNPGASNRIKCWSPLKFAELGDRLVGELDTRVIVVGGTEDRDLADEICAGMHNAPLDLVGKISLLQLGAVLKRCAVLVSGDTGPMHLATAVKTPVVALFGAIDPRRTGPVGEGHRVVRHEEVKCVPCVAKDCTNSFYLECMEKISVDEVFLTVSEMLKEK